MYIFFTFHLQLNYVYSLLGVMSMAFVLIKEESSSSDLYITIYNRSYPKIWEATCKPDFRC